LSQAPGVGVFVAQNEQGRSAWLLLYDETDHASRMPKLGQVRSKGTRGEVRRALQTAWLTRFLCGVESEVRSETALSSRPPLPSRRHASTKCARGSSADT
jgi:hypothetical protein